MSRDLFARFRAGFLQGLVIGLFALLALGALSFLLPPLSHDDTHVRIAAIAFRNAYLDFYTRTSAADSHVVIEIPVTTDGSYDVSRYKIRYENPKHPADSEVLTWEDLGLDVQFGIGMAHRGPFGDTVVTAVSRHSIRCNVALGCDLGDESYITYYFASTHYPKFVYAATLSSDGTISVHKYRFKENDWITI